MSCAEFAVEVNLKSKSKNKKSLADFFMQSPLPGSGVVIEHDPAHPRETPVLDDSVGCDERRPQPGSSMDSLLAYVQEGLTGPPLDFPRARGRRLREIDL